MSQEIKAYLWLEAKMAAAFNFFINGMIAGVIYHQVDLVPMDTLSIVVDFTITCLLIFTITAFFGRASLRRTKTAGILEPGNVLIWRLSRLFGHPIMYSLFMGLALATALSTLLAPVFAIAGLKAIPFVAYVLFKSMSCALIGSFATATYLYLGMIRAIKSRQLVYKDDA